MAKNTNRYNESAMVRQLEAVYEHGVLRPLKPLALTEHQLVRLTLEEQEEQTGKEQTTSENGNAAKVVTPADARREEFQWLATESASYAGQWVALDGNRLVAHGDELAIVSAAARAAGAVRPLLTHIRPEGELPFGGW